MLAPKLRIFLVVFPFFFGCVNGPQYPLDHDAESVLIIEKLSFEEKSQAKQLGKTICTIGWNGKTIDENKIECKNKLRNDAKKLGGNVVLIEMEHLPRKQRCSNCISLTGTVFNKN